MSKVPEYPVIPSMIGMLHDVDVSSAPPVDGDTLVWVDADKKWQPAGASVGGGLGNGAWDRFVITNTVTTDYPLSYVPRTNTLHLYLNGVGLDEGVDYTVDYTTPKITLTAFASRANGDVLWGRYMTTDRVAGQVQTTLIWGIRSDAATIIGSTDAVALIDSGVPFTDAQADLVPVAGKETDLVFGATTITPGVDGSYLFLRVYDAAPGIFRFDRISGVDGDTLIHAIAAATGAGTYRVDNASGTLTIKKNGTMLDTVTLTGGDAAALSRTLVGLRGNVSSGATTFENFTANGGVVADAFNRPDADQLGAADTGQNWVGTS